MTKDHVPAKVFFPRPLPSDLTTVPACKCCNKGISDDEEYLALKLMAYAIEFSPEARQVLRQLLPRVKPLGLRDGLVARVRNETRAVPVRSPAGLDLGNALVTVLDVPRVNRVLEKIVRGLFRLEYDAVLDPGARVSVEILPERSSMTEAIVAAALQTPSQWRGGRTFEYRQTAQGHAERTAWVMCFYRCIPALGRTEPQRGSVER